MVKRGKTYKIYLQPEDALRVEKDMEQAGYTARGPYFMMLHKQRQYVIDTRREAAKRIVKEAKGWGLQLKDLEKEWQ